MSDLEEAGYLTQPHASAGRVPTEAAFRLFIDALMRLRQLSAGDELKISGWFDELPRGTDLLRGAGRLLSDLTGAPAVLLRSREPKLTTVRFIPTRPGELLGVIVYADGTVENRFVAVEPAPDNRHLERLHNMLAEVVEGRTLRDVRDHFARTITEHRDELASLRQIGVSLLNATVEARRPAEVIIEGQARLLEHIDPTNAARLRDLVRALEEREKLVHLLDRIIETRRVQVLLAGETEERVGCPVSLVAAPFGEEGRPSGALGIIGPMPMDYPTVVPLVRATALAMSAALGPKGVPTEGD